VLPPPILYKVSKVLPDMFNTIRSIFSFEAASGSLLLYDTMDYFLPQAIFVRYFRSLLNSLLI
jgi:hypothetical protein